MEMIQQILGWIEEDDGEVMLLGDYNLPSMGAWEEIEVDLLRQRAEKREHQEAQVGFQTQGLMAWLDFAEEFRLL